MGKILLESDEMDMQAAYFNKSAFQRKSELILVLKTGISGLHHCVDKESKAGKDLLAKLVPGTELMLFRDTDNEHDEWAVAVYTKEDEKVGYLTRFKNETIARLMDNGRKFLAFVDEQPKPDELMDGSSVHALTEDFGLPFSVYMEDT